MFALRTEMTHGDKAKAKAGKKSPASAKTRGAKSGENGKTSRAQGRTKSAGAKASSEKGGSEKASKAAAGKKAGAEKGRGTSKAVASKERAAENGARAHGRADSDTFGDARLAAAFKHAVKKYPNAFRKLTD